MHPDEMNLKNVNGHVITTVNIPAHQQEVEIAYSAIDGCAIAAVQAWNAVRGDGDARFEVCDPNFRSTLMAHAESVYGGAAPLAGDTALARFEAEVARIKGVQSRDKEAAIYAAAHPAVAPNGPKIGVLESDDSNLHLSQANPAIGERHQGLGPRDGEYASDTKPAIGAQAVGAGQVGQPHEQSGPVSNTVSGQRVQDGHPSQLNPNNDPKLA